MKLRYFLFLETSKVYSGKRISNQCAVCFQTCAQRVGDGKFDFRPVCHSSVFLRWQITFIIFSIFFTQKKKISFTVEARVP